MTRKDLAPPGDIYAEGQSVKNLNQLLGTKLTKGPTIETINTILNGQPLTDEQLPFANMLGFENQTTSEGRGRI